MLAKPWKPRLGRRGGSVGLCILGDLEVRSLAGCHSAVHCPGRNTGGGGGRCEREDSLGCRPKGLQECLGDQPPVVLYWFYLLVTLPAGSRPKEAKEALAFLGGFRSRGDIKKFLQFGRKWASENLGESSFPCTRVKLKSKPGTERFCLGEMPEGPSWSSPTYISGVIFTPPCLPLHLPQHTHTDTFSSKKSKDLLSFSLHSSHISHLGQMSLCLGLFPRFPILG